MVIFFVESIIFESCYKIMLFFNEDKGKYFCMIINVVGLVLEEIMLGNVNLLCYFIFVLVNILSMLYFFKKLNQNIKYICIFIKIKFMLNSEDLFGVMQFIYYFNKM